MLELHPILAFTDNYIWALSNPENNQAIIVDPGEAGPALEYLRNKELELCAILITHHHMDHVGGLEEILEHYKVPVHGPLERIKHVSARYKEGDQITIDELSVQLDVLDIPGHTSGHIAWYNDTYLFCGDTLFAGGCGRLFEGTPEQMYQSLAKLKPLKPTTLVCCAHEYTESNLKFAKQVEPSNTALQERIKDTAELRKQQKPTLPSTIELELETNPFLRVDQLEVIESANKYSKKELSQPEEVFAAIRSWKDSF